MYLSFETFDDLMNDVLNRLLNGGQEVNPTRGKSIEIIGAMLHLKNPRARLSRTETRGKPFSALGELMWYLSGTNDLQFIEYYIKKYRDESEDGKTVYGGYGPRFFNLRGQYNQVENVIKLLKKKPSSRKAVIQLFDGSDLASEHKEIPCTCTLQLLIRQNKLHLFTTMRSNDAYVGLPHDVFAFTMLQEIFARILNVELGEYYHAVGSLHLYARDVKNAKKYLSEGFQSTKLIMPPMPNGDPRTSIQLLLDIESKIRLNSAIQMIELSLDPYWCDLARLIEIHALCAQKSSKSQRTKAIDGVKALMSNSIYNTYIENRLQKLK